VSFASLILNAAGIISAEHALALIGATFAVTLPAPALMFPGSKFVKTIVADQKGTKALPGARALRNAIKAEICGRGLEEI
jgi:hypothetical protein